MKIRAFTYSGLTFLLIMIASATISDAKTFGPLVDGLSGAECKYESQSCESKCCAQTDCAGGGAEDCKFCRVVVPNDFDPLSSQLDYSIGECTANACGIECNSKAACEGGDENCVFCKENVCTINACGTPCAGNSDCAGGDGKCPMCINQKCSEEICVAPECCTRNSDCAADQFCKRGDWSRGEFKCSGRGQCVSRGTAPCKGYTEADVVCACDDDDARQTKPNGCEANKLGLNVAHYGACGGDAHCGKKCRDIKANPLSMYEKFFINNTKSDLYKFVHACDGALDGCTVCKDDRCQRSEENKCGIPCNSDNDCSAGSGSSENKCTICALNGTKTNDGYIGVCAEPNYECLNEKTCAYDAQCEDEKVDPNASVAINLSVVRYDQCVASVDGVQKPIASTGKTEGKCCDAYCGKPCVKTVECSPTPNGCNTCDLENGSSTKWTCIARPADLVCGTVCDEDDNTACAASATGCDICSKVSPIDEYAICSTGGVCVGVQKVTFDAATTGDKIVERLFGDSSCIEDFLREYAEKNAEVAYWFYKEDFDAGTLLSGKTDQHSGIVTGEATNRTTNSNGCLSTGTTKQYSGCTPTAGDDCIMKYTNVDGSKRNLLTGDEEHYIPNATCYTLMNGRSETATYNDACFVKNDAEKITGMDLNASGCEKRVYGALDNYRFYDISGKPYDSETVRIDSYDAQGKLIDCYRIINRNGGTGYYIHSKPGYRYYGDIKNSDGIAELWGENSSGQKTAMITREEWTAKWATRKTDKYMYVSNPNDLHAKLTFDSSGDFVVASITGSQIPSPQGDYDLCVAGGCGEERREYALATSREHISTKDYLDDADEIKKTREQFPGLVATYLETVYALNAAPYDDAKTDYLFNTNLFLRKELGPKFGVDCFRGNGYPNDGVRWDANKKEYVPICQRTRANIELTTDQVETYDCDQLNSKGEVTVCDDGYSDCKRVQTNVIDRDNYYLRTCEFYLDDNCQVVDLAGQRICGETIVNTSASPLALMWNKDNKQAYGVSSFKLSNNQKNKWVIWKGSENMPLVVYDPKKKGKITSASQLFGLETFGKSWKNGFEALATLDLNKDGKISGEELKDISLWFDKGSDGVADKGEVKDAREAGVVELYYKGDESNPLTADILTSKGFAKNGSNGKKEIGGALDWFAKTSYASKAEAQLVASSEFKQDTQLANQLGRENFTGIWKWVMDKEFIDSEVLNANGVLVISDQNEEVYGDSYVSLALRNNKPGAKTGVKVIPFSKSQKYVSENGAKKVEFLLEQDGQKTVSTIEFSSDGKTLNGVSRVSGEDPVRGEYTAHYTWKAIRLTKK